jgi:hypothetical protein
MSDVEDILRRLDYQEQKIGELAKRVTSEATVKIDIRLEGHLENAFHIIAEAKDGPSDELRYDSGTIISELIASLNALIQVLAQRNGKNDVSDIDFLFGKSQEDWECKKKVKLAKILKAEHVQAIQELKPWIGGNDALTILQPLEKERKHYRSLSWAAAAGVNGMTGPGIVGMLRQTPQILEHLNMPYSICNGMGVTMHIHWQSTMVFGLPESARGKEVAQQLIISLNAVREAVRQFRE